MKMIKNNKLLLKIFSTLIAVVLWFAVTYTEDPSINQALTRLDTVFSNEETLSRRGLIIVDKDEIPSFSVTIRGRRSKVISSLDDVTASIDVSKITTAGEHEVDVEYIYPADAIMLTKAKFSSVTIKAEKLMTRRIPVKVSSKQNKKDKEHLVESESLVDTISVSGAQSVIDSLEYAEVALDTSAISSDCTASYPYTLHNSDGQIVDEKNISSKSHTAIDVNHTVHKKVEVPVDVVLSSDLRYEYTIDVKSQTPKSIYVGIDDDTELESLEAVFTREHLNAEEETVTLTIKAPRGIYIPEDSLNVTVTCEVTKKGSMRSRSTDSDR